MATNEELIKAANKLKSNCEMRQYSSQACLGCPFRSKNNMSCSIYEPFAWSISKPRRWTDADIQWAKAADSVHGYEITRSTMDKTCRVYADDGRLLLIVAQDLFLDLKPGETVHIDDVLKEGEQNG